MIHAGPTLGIAYERGVGLCSVEQLKGSTFMLIPHNPGRPAIIRQRHQIKWRGKSKKETA